MSKTDRCTAPNERACCTTAISPESDIFHKADKVRPQIHLFKRGQIFLIVIFRPEKQWFIPAEKEGLLFVLQAAITYLPFMNATFGTVPLSLSDWKYPFMLGIAVFLIVEAEKALIRKMDKMNAHPDK